MTRLLNVEKERVREASVSISYWGLSIKISDLSVGQEASEEPTERLECNPKERGQNLI